MISQWLESFAKWPPMNQLAFSCLLVICGFLLLVLFGYWVLQVIHAFRVAAYDKRLEANLSRLQLLYPGVPVFKPIQTGQDWKAEQRCILEEQEYQAEVQARVKEEMEQAEYARQLPQKNPEIPCTPEASAGHTSKEEVPEVKAPGA